METDVKQIPSNLTGLLHPYHDGFLADDGLGDLDVLVLALHLLESDQERAGIDFDALKNRFIRLGRRDRPNFGVSMHEARKQNLIEQDDATKVVRFKSRGLKRLESILGMKESSPVQLIKAGQAFSAIRLFEEFLSTQVRNGSIFLCDSHVSPETLFPFSQLYNSTELKILSSNLYDRDKFAAYSDRMKKENHVSIEIKKTYKLHDRYIISGDRSWSLGASIKDLGNKDTLIVELQGVTSSLRDLFDQRWIEATAF